jgi:hypothetical protein
MLIVLTAGTLRRRTHFQERGLAATAQPIQSERANVRRMAESYQEFIAQQKQLPLGPPQPMSCR